MITGDPTTPPENYWVDTVCLRGQGAACCKYLSFSDHQGFACQKLVLPDKAILDARVTAGTLRILGDNCTGRKGPV